ncbi:MAG: hypothetical protein GC154_02325 [bacterium]|nr:hypothetical protein [bacterium]
MDTPQNNVTAPTTTGFLSLFTRSENIALGFGMTVAMWAIGYVFHLPGIQLPSPVMFGGFLLCLLIGGYIAARRTPYGWKAGFVSGAISSILNFLVLGSVLSNPDTPNKIPHAMIYIPGFLAAGAILAAIGGLIGSGVGRSNKPPLRGASALANVACCATFILLIAGGLVTSYDAGLAVVDWPNTFGYNMFLYPLSRMTGGIYYEHTHRLIGSLVGLTTLTLCCVVWASETRGWVKKYAAGALALVIIQGIMGGLRVTGKFTLSTSPNDVAPSIALAIVHGVTGQLFFAMLIGLAAAVSTRWKSNEAPQIRSSAAVDRWLGAVLIALIVFQLTLGAVLRHISEMLMAHITFAGIVYCAALIFGVRIWGFYSEKRILGRLGLGLCAIVSIQLLLGFGALWAIKQPGQQAYSALEVLLPTLHQGVGALTLGAVVLAYAWTLRLTASPESDS